MTDQIEPARPRTPYGEYLAEQEEILRLKWIVSEREGRDVGFEYALNQWSRQHRAQWRIMRNRLIHASHSSTGEVSK